MLKLVLKVRLQALISSMFVRGAKKGKGTSAGKIILFSLLFAYAFAAVGFSLGMMLHMLAEVFVPAGLGWVYFVFVGFLALMLGFVGSVFITKSELFEARDNELLLSMPIRPAYILAGRLLMVWVVELVYSLIVFIPAGIVYFLFVPVSFWGIIAYIICCVAMTLLTLTLTCFFGWIFAMITRNMARKNLFTTIVMFGFFALYMYFYANLQNFISAIVEKGEAFADAVRKAIPPVYFFARGSQGELLELILFLLCAVLPFALVVWVLSATFIKIATKRVGIKAKRYRGGGLAVSGVIPALIKKELKRFFSLPIYLFNSGIGMVMLLLFVGFLLFKGKDFTSVFAEAPMIAQYIPAGCAVILSFCAAMSATTAPSLSLEGKSFDLLKSMPLRARDIYAAKIAANLIITMPVILAGAAAMQFALEADILSRIILFLLPVSVQLFTAVFGMLCNIRFPRFEWINETLVIKQSVSVTISVFVGMGLLVLPVFLYIFVFAEILSASLFCLAVAAVLIAVTALLWKVICTWGEKKYAAMT